MYTSFFGNDNISISFHNDTPEDIQLCLRNNTCMSTSPNIHSKSIGRLHHDIKGSRGARNESHDICYPLLSVCHLFNMKPRCPQEKCKVRGRLFRNTCKRHPIPSYSIHIYGVYIATCTSGWDSSLMPNWWQMLLKNRNTPVLFP